MTDTFEQDSLGTQELPGNSRTVGVAYIVIPKDVDRENYIANCLSTHTLMIRGEHGDTFRKVPISKNLIDEIDFPIDTNTKGSAVIWVRASILNSLVIVGILKLQDKASDVFSENLWSKIRKGLNGYANVSINGNDPSVNININSTKSGDGKIAIRLINPDDTAVFDIYSKGTINLLCTKEFSIGSYKSFELYTVDNNLNKKASFSYKIGEGFVMYDEYDNKITLDKNGVKIEDTNNNIITADGNGVLMTPATGKKINVGGNGEPMVLGDKLNVNLNSFITNIQSLINVLTVFSTTEAAASAPSPLTPMGAGFTALGAALIPITTSLSTLANDLNNQLSNNSTVL